MRYSSISFKGDRWQILLHEQSLGITLHALKALRDELTSRLEHEVQVYQVPALDKSKCRCYGFIVLDSTEKEVVIVGDGFRGDNRGEGGAGHRAVQALLSIHGIRVIELPPEEGISFCSKVEAYQQEVQLILGFSEFEPWLVPIELVPGYIDYILLTGGD